eukprot:TRINITY_DN33201_c0_g1_i1.p1 TRINITY_DN33201_c0_g1~~TRINITY_DN33201_c0_g1_i1.p1  ORF type:complete len:647 (+),score=99.28 TRINITY_DN33201_c0_g1_i1:288-1943(+)
MCAGVNVKKVEYAVISAGALVCFGVDYSGVMDSGRVWSVMVLFTDLGLVFNLANNFNVGLVAATVSWLFYVMVDVSILGWFREVRKFDGFDALPPYQQCDCAEPPCKLAVTEAVPDMLAASLVFLIDFFLTRGFAVKMRTQLAQMEATISMSQAIALHLSRYEVGEAESVIQMSGQALPEELQAIFTSLVRNLTQYKAYLPMSCLPAKEGRASGQSHNSVSDTGSDAGRAASFSIARRRSRMASAWSEASSDRVASPSHRTHSGEGLVLRQDPRRKPVTLMCMNHHGFIRAVDGVSPAETAELINTLTQEFAQDILSCRGVVDLVSGDHFFASFNASRPCLSHRTAAVRSGMSLTRISQDGLDGPSSAAIVSGPACCGDFGSEQHCLIRYMVVSPISSTILLLERLATSISAPLLVDAKVHEGIGPGIDCLAWSPVQFPEKLDVPRSMVWLVTGERSVQEEVAEWMYQLDTLGDDPWDAYNSAARLILSGDPEAAVSLSRIVPTNDREEAVLARLRRMAASGPLELEIISLREACGTTPKGCPVAPWAISS